MSMVEVKVNQNDATVRMIGEANDCVVESLIIVRALYDSIARKEPIKAQAFLMAIPSCIAVPDALEPNISVDLSHLGGKNREKN